MFNGQPIPTDESKDIIEWSEDLVDDIEMAFDKHIDFIVEQNPSTTAGYRKWNSGLVEIWGRDSKAPGSQSVTLPTNVIGQPRVLMNVTRSGGYLNLAVQAKEVLSGVLGYYTWATTGSPPGDIPVDYYLIGTWK